MTAREPNPRIRRVDARGMLCPLPALRAALVLESMAVGELLSVRFDDPTSMSDLPGWCRESGHGVVSLKTIGAIHTLLIRKGPQTP